MSTMVARFRDRYDAGRQLAAKLREYAHRSDLLILALPRGGVPVASEVAQALNAPLDVFLVRKLSLPGFNEIAIGAIASGGVVVRNPLLPNSLHLLDHLIAWLATHERQTLEQREYAYRGNAPSPDMRGKTVILVDDGLATGTTMRAALAALRQYTPAHLVVAVPTAPPETCAALRTEVDELVCILTPQPFDAVSRWYADFAQTTDAQVCDLLLRCSQPLGDSVRRAQQG
jgi:putative phosphoribosyl transferase